AADGRSSRWAGDNADETAASTRRGGQAQARPARSSLRFAGVFMTDPGFVHLHVHSSYSLLEGALSIARLAELAKADRQPALALTDTGNMFGVLEFSEKMASAGIQPIIGCALALDFEDQEPRPGAPAPEPPRIVLLAASQLGYRSLTRLNSRAFLES